MDSTLILADLRAQFGAKKTVLYADELAEALGKSVEAIYSLTARDGLPVPILVVGGRPAASIYAVAEWLSGNAVKAKKSRPESSKTVSIPEPKRKRASLGKYLLGLQVQQAFLSELHAAIESNLLGGGDTQFSGLGDDENDTTFDDFVEPFLVSADGTVICHARPEVHSTVVANQLSPPSSKVQWMTWDKALSKVWQNEETRLQWLTKSEAAYPGLREAVEANRVDILSKI
jgi:hypothetical protein